MSTLLTRLKTCRNRSVPLVVVNTPDQQAFVEQMTKALNGDTVAVQWDFARGMTPCNQMGADAMGNIDGANECVGSPPFALGVAQQLPSMSVMFVHNAQRFMDDVSVIQSIANLRSPFAASNRMLILMGPFVDVPAELRGDVLSFDEPLPDFEEIEGIVERIMDDAGLRDGRELNATPTDCANALRGLPAFQVQQLAALNLTKDGVNMGGLWDAVRQSIRSTKGLSMVSDSMTYDDLGGLDAAKEHASRVINGPLKPTCVVWLDEIEKALAGKNDLTGVTQDQIGVLLTYLEEKRQRGFIFLGHPGTGKSALAKAMGAEHGIPTLRADLGDMMGSLVGQSQQYIREFVKVVESISGGNAIWVATCNGIDALPAELQARFSLGTYFFDLPGEDEREIMWKIHRDTYQLTTDDTYRQLDDNGWVGRDIRNCCDTAWTCGVSLNDAAGLITPLCRTGKKEIEARQNAADGRYLDANRRGSYRKLITRESAVRSVQL